jgi:hypothetical protein
VSDFEEALRGTLAHQNRAFEQADADLRAETAAASVVIENLTNKRGALRLGPAQEKDDGVWYELWLHFRPADQATPAQENGPAQTKKYTLGTFFVPWKGFPIRTGVGRELPDRPSIAAYFVDMARNPTSPLVSYLTFNLRPQQPLSA